MKFSPSCVHSLERRPSARTSGTCPPVCGQVHSLHVLITPDAVHRTFSLDISYGMYEHAYLRILMRCDKVDSERINFPVQWNTCLHIFTFAKPVSRRRTNGARMPLESLTVGRTMGVISVWPWMDFVGRKCFIRVRRARPQGMTRHGPALFWRDVTSDSELVGFRVPLCKLKFRNARPIFYTYHIFIQWKEQPH